MSYHSSIQTTSCTGRCLVHVRPLDDYSRIRLSIAYLIFSGKAMYWLAKFVTLVSHPYSFPFRIARTDRDNHGAEGNGNDL